MRRNYPQLHKRAWERANNACIMPGMHVHHIDGNHDNNNPCNLIVVTAAEHFALHYDAGDVYACKLLLKTANVAPGIAADIHKKAGIASYINKSGFHSWTSDQRAEHARNVWRRKPPGRIPVTDGVNVRKFHTDSEAGMYIEAHPSYIRGVPQSHKVGLSKSKYRIDSVTSKKLAQKRLTEGTHNFTIVNTCPHCGKTGKGPMMHRWHFDKCRY